ncbi:MAG TPA: hypothetical protein VGS19_25470, partial [Streptosporangiaceae bacterium]|nr:hypothetical protein [Streptosporangiaceae bacterium]
MDRRCIRGLALVAAALIPLGTGGAAGAASTTAAAVARGVVPPGARDTAARAPAHADGRTGPAARTPRTVHARAARSATSPPL